MRLFRKLEQRPTSGRAQLFAGPDSFVEAVDEILKGGHYLSRVVAQKVALMNIRAGDHPLKDLTAREIDVLRLLGCGKGLGEIADALQISYRTVANTVSIIKRKLNVPTHVKLMQIAIEHAKPNLDHEWGVSPS